MVMPDRAILDSLFKACLSKDRPLNDRFEPLRSSNPLREETKDSSWSLRLHDFLLRSISYVKRLLNTTKLLNSCSTASLSQPGREPPSLSHCSKPDQLPGFNFGREKSLLFRAFVIPCVGGGASGSGIAYDLLVDFHRLRRGRRQSYNVANRLLFLDG